MLSKIHGHICKSSCQSLLDGDGSQFAINKLSLGEFLHYIKNFLTYLISDFLCHGCNIGFQIEGKYKINHCEICNYSCKRLFFGEEPKALQYKSKENAKKLILLSKGKIKEIKFANECCLRELDGPFLKNFFSNLALPKNFENFLISEYQKNLKTLKRSSYDDIDFQSSIMSQLVDVQCFYFKSKDLEKSSAEKYDLSKSLKL